MEGFRFGRPAGEHAPEWSGWRTWDSTSTPRPGGCAASSCTGRILSSKGSPPATRTRCSSTTCCGCAGRAPSTTDSPTCCVTGASPSISSATCSPRPWRSRQARALVLDRVFDEKEYGPLATDHLRAAFESLPADGTGRGPDRRHDQARVPRRAHGADLGPLPRHGARRLPPRPPPQPPLHPRHLRLDLRRRLHQRHALARPSARDRPLRGDLPAPSRSSATRRSTSGRRGRPTTRPPSRAATSSSSATAPSSSA